MHRYSALLLTAAVLLAGCKDTQKPAWPAAAALESDDVTGSSLTLSWPAATDNEGVTAYRIRGVREDEADKGLPRVIGKVRSPKTSFSAEGLSEGAEYAFKITALDRAGNVSAPLSMTAATSDVTRPAFSEGARLTFTRTDADGEATLTFSWPAAADNVGVTRYRLKLGQEITPIKGAARSHKIATKSPGGTWLLEAGDAAGNWCEQPLSVRVPSEPGPTAEVLAARAAARRRALAAAVAKMGVLKLLGTRRSAGSADLIGGGSLGARMDLDRAFARPGGLTVAGKDRVGGGVSRGGGGGGGRAVAISGPGADAVRAKAGPRVRVSSGPVETSRYVRRKYTRIKFCYVKALAQAPGLTGSMKLTLAVNDSGRVSATVDNETLKNAPLIQVRQDRPHGPGQGRGGWHLHRAV